MRSSTYGDEEEIRRQLVDMAEVAGDIVDTNLDGNGVVIGGGCGFGSDSDLGPVGWEGGNKGKC
ncbi:hypothetical protein HID58_038683 [Brassica napus]|uniref:Uncharacterized protein n=1 Tax=Brassica napus TaxID=3708 RepID=A0ABQ8BPU4_BRANA|nr:hypothetical protein HID58_038683 [Brassica napus]